MVFGYARVSTKHQSFDMQVDALEKAGCDRIYKEKLSATKKNRPELDRLLESLRPGDKVVVWKLDRIGRSMSDMVKLANHFIENEIQFESLTQGIRLDDSAFGKMVFNIFSAFAEFERDLISERTKAGLDAARQKGRVGGRPKGLSKQAKIKAAAAATLYKKNEYTVKEICNELKISSSTLYKYLAHEKVNTGATRKTQ